MKKISLALISALLLSIPVIAIAANPVAGAKCAKVGLVQTYNSKKFTCVKSGKNLIWNRGTSVSKSEIPIVKPSETVPSANPIDLTLRDFETISKASYLSVRQNWPNNHSNIQIQYHITESFPKEFITDWKSQVERTADFYSQFIDSNQTFHIYFVTELDQDWMEQQGIWSSSNLPTFFKYWRQGQASNNCEGAAAWYLKGPNETSASLYGGIAIATKSQKGKMLLWCDHVISHEMFHSVQDYWLTLKQGNTGFANSDVFDSVEIPIFREGSADTIATAIGEPTYEKYFAAFKQRFGDSLPHDAPNLLKLKTESEIIKYLKDSELRSGFNEAHQVSYFLGMMVFEYAIYKFGMDKYIALLKAQNKNQNFREVFNAIYGFQIDELYSQSAKHVLDGIKVLAQ